MTARSSINGIRAVIDRPTALNTRRRQGWQDGHSKENSHETKAVETGAPADFGGNSRRILGRGPGARSVAAARGMDAGWSVAVSGVLGFQRAIARLESLEDEVRMAREQESRAFHDDAPDLETQRCLRRVFECCGVRTEPR